MSGCSFLCSVFHHQILWAPNKIASRKMLLDAIATVPRGRRLKITLKYQ
jgi:hypothetical protein